jgi:dissimilatory sulfite reductase related protein
MLADLTAIAFNEEGFMTDPSQWTKEIAIEIARLEGIETLTDDHWKIIDYCRQTGMTSGKSPTLRQITTGTGISPRICSLSSPRDLPRKLRRSPVSANLKVVCNYQPDLTGFENLSGLTSKQKEKFHD